VGPFEHVEILIALYRVRLRRTPGKVMDERHRTIGQSDHFSVPRPSVSRALHIVKRGAGIIEMYIGGAQAANEECLGQILTGTWLTFRHDDQF
jgi:hypothetical protein